LHLLRTPATRTAVSILLRGLENQLEVIAAVASSSFTRAVGDDSVRARAPGSRPIADVKHYVPPWCLLNDRMDVVVASPQLQALFECHAPDLLGDRWEQFFDHAVLVRIIEQWMFTAQTRRPIEVYGACRTARGRTFNVIHHASPRINLRRNTLDGYLATFTPV